MARTGRRKPTLELNEQERQDLERYERGRTTAQALALRARIVLRCASGMPNDNSSIHNAPEIRRWLKRHPRFCLHFTPTSSSWLNLIERWFASLTDQALRRSSHTRS
jgi:hypothetical protein